LLLVKAVSKVLTTVVAVDGQMVVMVLKVMLLAQVAEVLLVYSSPNMVQTGSELLLKLLLVLVVAVVTNQEVPVEDQTVITAVAVLPMVLLKLLVAQEVKVKTELT
jgi:hypothetical protein